MLFFVPKEGEPAETRAPVIPEGVAKLVRLGATVTVESGVGASCFFADADYERAGGKVTTDRASALGEADAVLRLLKPPIEEVDAMKRGALHISLLDPFNENALVDRLAAAGVSAFSMDMIPRTTRAQKMDALSSQASLAGYAAVLVGAGHLRMGLPMMMTPAGTLKPATVFVIGAGVAGLQAIATAKRLGARVEAFDTRPVVEEQVQSLGAKFVKVDLGETGQTKDGYAKELTPEQQALQRKAMASVCARSDLVVTTAKLFGRKSPIIITREMVARMKPGSIIVDLAIESGGNVEGAELGQAVDLNGVIVLGYPSLERRVAVHASQMYSANLSNLIESFWNKEQGSIVLNLEDEIIRGCLVTHGGAIVHELVKTVREKEK